jgi:predicted lysophospholipase L1 biosynthesis ABC-type transport system permease subunit
VPLHVENQVIVGQVVATTNAVPSVDGDAVLADLPTWLTAANAAEPGTTTVSELWLDAPPAAAARLARPPFSQLDVSSQRAQLETLRGDPLARGAIALLLVTALVALVLAATGVLLGVVGDLRDESGALFDLSAQGATPAQLRRHLLLRGGAVATLGIALGVAAGAIVCALVVAVVTVTAGAANAVPSLVLDFDWPVVAVALACVALASAATSALAVRRLR